MTVAVQKVIAVTVLLCTSPSVFLQLVARGEYTHLPYVAAHVSQVSLRLGARHPSLNNQQRQDYFRPCIDDSADVLP